MLAARLTAPNRLEIAQIDDPTPGPGGALIRVHAAAVTRDELTWPLDRLPAIPSYEISGTVAALGSGANSLAVDDEVFALTPFDRDGGAAEYAVVPSAVVASRASGSTCAEHQRLRAELGAAVRIGASSVSSISSKVRPFGSYPNAQKPISPSTYHDAK